MGDTAGGMDGAGRAALIADVVRSRAQGAGSALVDELLPVLARLNAELAPRQAIAFTVGDELQGVFDSVAAALRAGLVLQLAAHPIAIRVGIGLGTITQTAAAPAPLGQTGTAWWLAREAVEAVEAAEAPQRLPGLRTMVRMPDPAAERLLNAHLATRDHVVSRMDATDRRVLLGLLRGRTQAEIAADLGLDPSAVSKRAGRNGAKHVAWAQETVEQAGV